MSTRRTARVASVVREVVSTSILQELRDPRIRNVTVLGAEVSPDLRYAKIRISVRGTERDASLTLHGLESARGYLQSKVADRLKTRYTPELRFELDEGIRKSFEATQILKELLPEQTDSDALNPEAASATEDLNHKSAASGETTSSNEPDSAV